MPDIKVRAVVEKTVKTIDKSAIAAQRMKSAYVQTKEKAEQRNRPTEESPEGYAADRVSDSVTVTTYEGARQFDRQGRKGLDTTKENLAKAKERFQRKRLTDPLKKKAQEKAAETAHLPVDIEDSTQQTANPIRRLAGRSKK